ncbi:GTP-binding protein [Geomonas sp. Red69]|uniref:GTP-binding protein n=1 Tax=Geomonas diazotrophica TaxID=2843197 RepID=UPI001C11E416|nr:MULTISPECIES: GTP-binding protein [Geomonas]MBU5636068.1 GTP-binding protein [Geomonas diazotrophica]QXE85037.1 GTP-binding protein [Geomonas nitrogeniifigens]
MRPFPIVITGHVDHGKSTLIGRLLYDTGALQADRLAEMRQSSHDAGKASEFAFVLDAFEEERQRGITIDTSQIYFTSSQRNYVIIDAPGHREFIRNMLTGASYADAAVLMVDAVEGICPQTRRHAKLLAMVGIKEICVLINKLDQTGYDRERYLEVADQVRDLFAEFSGTPFAIIPISALTGENVASRALEGGLSWYFGPCFLEVLDAIDTPPIEERPFRFAVQDVYPHEEGAVLVGKVDSGRLSTGDWVAVWPEGCRARVRGIARYPALDVGAASYGDAVGLFLDVDRVPQRGEIVAGEPAPRSVSDFGATIFWFADSYVSGRRVVVRCATQAVAGVIELLKVYDPAAPDDELDPESLNIGEMARCRIRTEAPLVIDSFAVVPELGRFVIECDGVPAGAGIVA